MDKEFFVKNKKKIIISIVILAVALIGFSLVNSTYSLFYHEETASNTESYSTGLLSIVASSKGETISLNNTLPISDTDGINTTPYTFTIKNIGNLDYKFNVKLLSTSSSDTTIDPQYIKIKIDDGNVTTLSSLTNSIIKSDITLAAGDSIDISIRIWLSIDTPNSQIGRVFNSKIVTDGQAVYTSTNNEIPAAETLRKLGLTVDTSHTPDFTTVSGNNGVKVDDNTGTETPGQGDGTNGIYVSEDDFGTSYYFRGAVENNYVSFANYYWRIIRINGDGSIRMIYAGTSPHENGYNDSSTYDTRIGTSAYNSSYNDNAYVGYMYGTAGSTTYAETHSNTNDSTIKTLVDDWYQNVLSGSSYAIADTIYCNDRSVTPVDSFAGMAITGTGIGTEETAYSNLKRNYIDHTPSLKCTNINDRFTVSNDIGNKALTYPVGLITTDEVAMAGGLTYDPNTISYITNTDYYLYAEDMYWTMTPDAFTGGYAGVGHVNDGGYLFPGFVDSDYGVRPVVSLNSDAISRGSGTMIDPFVVEGINVIIPVN